MTENEQKRSEEVKSALSERRETLWMLVFAPTTWAIHFTVSYVTAAVWCAKVSGRTGLLGGAKLAIVIFTLAAIVVIALTAWRGWKNATFDQGLRPFESDTNEDRHRFLGFATVLLSGLSFVATLYVSASIIFLESCR